jgi:hypothetical protein
VPIWIWLGTFIVLFNIFVWLGLASSEFQLDLMALFRHLDVGRRGQIPPHQPDLAKTAS